MPRGGVPTLNFFPRRQIRVVKSLPLVFPSDTGWALSAPSLVSRHLGCLLTSATLESVFIGRVRSWKWLSLSRVQPRGEIARLRGANRTP